MRKLTIVLAIGLSFRAPTLSAEEYVLGPDSQRQANVPQGKVTKYEWTSKIYPGTVRDYWVYVPAQYKPDKPACTMVFQDGISFVNEAGAFRATIVFDNLIAKGEMPVTIGVFINPGVVTPSGPGTMGRFDRSYEYDAVGPRFPHFLMEEILPEVASHYNLSKDPNDRAISGSSSGGNASFNAAWSGSDAFHRVLSFIGGFTNLRRPRRLANRDRIRHALHRGASVTGAGRVYPRRTTGSQTASEPPRQSASRIGGPDAAAARAPVCDRGFVANRRRQPSSARPARRRPPRPRGQNSRPRSASSSAPCWACSPRLRPAPPTAGETVNCRRHHLWPRLRRPTATVTATFPAR